MYCTGHQQQIACMAFNHRGDLLATGSWDSTCMLWTVPALTYPEHQLQAPIRPTLVHIFPVDDSGVLALAFAQDDASLVTCGECMVKVWNVAQAFGSDPKPDPDTVSSSTADTMSNQLAEWESVIPYLFSVERSMRLLEFDESLDSLISNHDWTASATNPCAPARHLIAPRRECNQEEVLRPGTTSADVNQCLDSILESVTVFSSDPLNEQPLDSHLDCNSNRLDSNDGDTRNPLVIQYERAQFRAEYKKMDSFHFAQLLNPAAPVDCISEDAKVIIHRPRGLADDTKRLLRVFDNSTQV